MAILEIIKIPLTNPIKDIHQSFQSFGSDFLRLDLLENRTKLKPNLPMIPVNMNMTAIIKKSPRASERSERSARSDNSDTRSASPAPSLANSDDDIAKKLSPDDDDAKSEIADALKEDGDDHRKKDHQNDEHRDNEHRTDEKDHHDDERRDDKRDQDEESEAEQPPQKTEEEIIEDYIDKFEILRKKYKNADIPLITKHTPLSDIEYKYRRIIKRVTLDSTVENYRNYMVLSFAGIEFATTQWLGIDMEGYTKEQIRNMETYDTLLIELGEKSYSITDNWPVEIKLVVVILFQAIVFYVGKKIAARAGETISNLFRGLTTNTIGSTQSSGIPKPSLTPEQIRNMTKAT